MLKVATELVAMETVWNWRHLIIWESAVPVNVMAMALQHSSRQYTLYKYQLSPANLRDVLHHSKRAANKGGRSV